MAPRVSKNPTAAERIERLRQDLEKAKVAIRRAQQRQSHYADQHRRDVTFVVGDRVLLSTDHLKLVGSDSRTPKFASRYIGPFRIKRVVGPNAYELELPEQMRIHPVLNVSRLKPYRDGFGAFPARPQPLSRPPPELVREDGAEEYEVERIVAKRGTGARAEFLVEWKGYPMWEATWTKLRDLGGAREALEEFEASLQD